MYVYEILQQHKEPLAKNRYITKFHTGNKLKMAAAAILKTHK